MKEYEFGLKNLTLLSLFTLWTIIYDKNNSQMSYFSQEIFFCIVLIHYIFVFQHDNGKLHKSYGITYVYSDVTK